MRRNDHPKVFRGHRVPVLTEKTHSKLGKKAVRFSFHCRVSIYLADDVSEHKGQETDEEPGQNLIGCRRSFSHGAFYS